MILGIVAGLLSKRYPLFPALSLVDSRYFFFLNDVYFVPSSLNFIKNTPNVRFFSNVWGVVQGFSSFLLHFILQRGQIEKYKKSKKRVDNDSKD
ncbi:TPA: hypothetical protein ACQNXQ_001294, partial [Streptococcus pyogenes]